MRKILLAVALMTTTLVANAASTSGVLNIDGTVTSSCAVTFSRNVSFILIPNSSPGAMSTLLTISCTAGSQITSFTSTSANGWQLKSTTNPNSPDVVPYFISRQGTYPTSYADAFIYFNWSGYGQDNTIQLLNNGTPLTIDNNGTPIQIDLAVQLVDNIVPAGLNVGAYSDTVTDELFY